MREEMKAVKEVEEQKLSNIIQNDGNVDYQKIISRPNIIQERCFNDSKILNSNDDSN
jgi:hypothetical protein